MHKDPTKTQSMKRREDCNKDKTGCRLFKKFIQKQYQDDHIQLLLSNQSRLNPNQKRMIYESVSWYDKFVRTGDELFVPQYLTDKLIEQSK